MTDAALGGAVMGLIFGFLGFLIGAWLLRVIMLRHIELQLAAILKELRSRSVAGLVALSVAGSLSLPPAAMHGQISARQGERQFTSPMILEIPLQEFMAGARGVPWTTVHTKDYVCDGVVLPSLVLTATPPKAPAKGIQVIVFARNETGSDKEVIIKLELVSDGAAVASVSVKHFELEEGQSKRRKALLPIPHNTKSDPPPVLRITLSVYSD